MTLVDSNVVIDVLDRDPIWYSWSAGAIEDAGTDGAAWVNPIIIAELSRGFDALQPLVAKLHMLELELIGLDDESAFTAGKRFVEYRHARASEERGRLLPDFLIGAHALVLAVPLLTRDPRLYRRYFPELSLITPETHP